MPSLPSSKMGGSASDAAADQGRLLIGFTCNVCEARTHRTMSKHSYTRGIVIIECPSCSSRHLIADNLSWFDQRGPSPDIERILAERGEAVRRSWRVDEEGAIFECLHGEAGSAPKEPSVVEALPLEAPSTPPAATTTAK